MSVGAATPLFGPAPGHNPAASLRLLCIPHAGAGAAVFHPLVRAAPPEIEVCGVRLPARESRLGEPPLREMAAVADAVATAVAAADADMPYSFYGQCTGALVAFEATRELRRRGAKLPTRLFVWAQPAPHLETARERSYDLPRDALLEHLRAVGATDEAILADPDLFELLEPAIRADLEVVETHRHLEEPLLDVPMTVFGGIDDPLVDFDGLSRWRDLTSAEFTLRQFAVDHVPAAAAWKTILRCIEADLGLADRDATG